MTKQRAARIKTITADAVNESTTKEDARNRAAGLWTPCSPGCKGWFIGSADDERGHFVMKCDECGRFEYDDDAAALPEARRALAAHLVPRRRGHTRASLRRERALALEAHALRMALSDVRAWASAPSAVDRVARIREIAEEALDA